MSDNCVKTENLSKRFFILQKEKTTFRALKALIKRESLKKEFWALRNISFEIKKGDKVAIIGKNGSGKTTLLRILTGIYDKTSGSLRIEGQPKALFSYWLGFNIDLSVIDNIYLCGAIHGIGRFFLKQNMSKVLEMTELYHLRFSPLKELSSGQQHRLAFTIFSLTPSDLLIFDDSLNFDQAFSQKCEL
jgi:ABC-type polysaccharide/polyol phosphate transport system ATPase subunit